MYKESKSGQIDVQRNKNTRLGFIYEAMRPLADQKLIINNVRELRIIPKVELYERLDFLYHDQNRYWEIMDLIQETKGVRLMPDYRIRIVGCKYDGFRKYHENSVYNLTRDGERTTHYLHLRTRAVRGIYAATVSNCHTRN